MRTELGQAPVGRIDAPAPGYSFGLASATRCADDHPGQGPGTGAGHRRIDAEVAMSGLAALEVAIGLGFVYLAFSLVISRINEAVASWLQWRAKGLELGIRQLLTGKTDAAEAARLMAGSEADGQMVKGLAELAGLTHPLVDRLGTPRAFGRAQRRPSYVSARTFSTALLDVLAPAEPAEPAGPDEVELTSRLRALVNGLATRHPRPTATIDALLALLPAEPDAVLAPEARRRFQELLDAAQDLKDQDRLDLGLSLLGLATASNAAMARVAASLEQLPAGNPVREPLMALANQATGSIETFRANVEQWFDDAMDRMSGWYKRRVQIALLVYAIVVVVLLNVDSITLTRSLWTDGVLRSAVVATADQQQDQDPGEVTDELDKLAALQLPIGWAGAGGDPRRQFPDDPAGVAFKLLGLAVTVGALSAGAPFWFDALSRIAKLRSTGPPPTGN
jgi:hypothetical protein